MEFKKYHFSNIESDNETWDKEYESDESDNCNFSDIESVDELENIPIIDKIIFTLKDLFSSLILFDLKNIKM